MNISLFPLISGGASLLYDPDRPLHIILKRRVPVPQLASFCASDCGLWFSPAAHRHSCAFSLFHWAISRDSYLRESETLSLIITAICSAGVFTLYLHSLLCFSNTLTLIFRSFWFSTQWIAGLQQLNFKAGFFSYSLEVKVTEFIFSIKF